MPSIFDDEGGAGALEFFVDGCVPFGTIIILGYNCTPTAASYFQIVGSIPALGLSQQSLFVGNLIGGAPERFPLPIAFSQSVQGGGTALLSIPLSQALGLDPASAVAVHVQRVHADPSSGRPAKRQTGDRDGRGGRGGAGAGVAGAARDRAPGLRAATAAPRTLAARRRLRAGVGELAQHEGIVRVRPVPLLP